MLEQLKTWIANLDSSDRDYERYVLEGLWVSWGMNQVSPEVLEKCLTATSHEVRAAAVKVLRFCGHQLPNQVELLKRAAKDEHGRVRLEALTAATWLKDEDQVREVLALVATSPMETWIEKPYLAALDHLSPYQPKAVEDIAVPAMLSSEEQARFLVGREIYLREGYCVTCHQEDGAGLKASGFPPLSGNEWVQGDVERLAKITLYGLYGPIEVAGTAYPGQVPMTAFGQLLDDDEIAAVLTYIRSSFGNLAGAVSPQQVKKVRDESAGRTDIYTAEQLLKEHPFSNSNEQ